MRKPQKPKKQNLDANFSLINPNAAGIDIGADRHWVSIPLGRDEENVRSFACFTADLYAMTDWLKQCGIETVAMESTGVYWIPVFQVLESRGFEVNGLLSGSFRPEDQICMLRSYIRQRDNLIKSACAHVQRMQKALTQMNIQLHRVISDITGTTGLNIIRAIVAGERNPITLASFKDGRIKASLEDIAASLTGDYRPELVFILEQELQLYEFYQTQIQKCDRQIEQCLASFADKV